MSLLAQRRFELGPVPRGTLRADPDRLAQALRNLIGNAIDHTVAERGLVRMLRRSRTGGTHAIRGRGRRSRHSDRPARARLRSLLPHRRGPRPRLGRHRARAGDRAARSPRPTAAEWPPGAHPRAARGSRSSCRDLRGTGRRRGPCTGSRSRASHGAGEQVSSGRADRRAPAGTAQASTASAAARAWHGPRRRGADRGHARRAGASSRSRGAASTPSALARSHAGKGTALAAAAPVGFVAHRLTAALPSPLQDAAAVALPDGTLALLRRARRERHLDRRGTRHRRGARVRPRSAAGAPARRSGRAARRRCVRVRGRSGQLV